jgi:hypothetical protein
MLAHSSPRATTSLFILVVVVVNNRHRLVLLGCRDFAVLFGTSWCLCLWVGVLVVVFTLDVWGCFFVVFQFSLGLFIFLVVLGLGLLGLLLWRCGVVG